MRSMNLLALVAAFITTVAAQDDTPSGPTMTGSPSNCNAWYTVVSGDDCPKVEKKFGITADQFFKWNPAVSRDCTTNFWLGESYCVGVGPSKATSSKTSSKPKTTTTTSKPSSSSTVSKTTSSTSTKTTPYSTRLPVTSRNITTPTMGTEWPPSKTQAGEPSSCNNWHYVVQGDTCQMIVNQYGNTLSMKNLLAWNPAIKSDCSALFNGFWLCIGVKATTSSSFDWYNTPNTTIPSPTQWTSSPVPTINSTFSFQPQPNGIPSSCQNFWKANDGDTCDVTLKQYPYLSKANFFKWNPNLNGNCNGLWTGYWYCVADYSGGSLPQPPTQTKPGSPTGSGTASGCKAWYQSTDEDTCDVVAQLFGSFSSSDFIKWNPSVGSDCSSFKDKYYYCVGVAGTPTTRTSSVPASTTGTSIPTQSGTTSKCNSYWLVSDTDTCDSVTSAAGISMDQFTEWNPAVKNSDGDCKLKEDDNVCIGVSS